MTTNALVSRIVIETTRSPEFIDITERVIEHVRASNAANGLVSVYSMHTTAAIKINEHEPLLIKDMEEFLCRMAAPDAYYRHNDFEVRTVNMTEDERANGHAHCQHLLMSTSETLPIIDGEVQLGRWQRIFLIELDGTRPRTREVLITVVAA
jgi:secondary thiamine-phosphate synthase enzyme